MSPGTGSRKKFPSLTVPPLTLLVREMRRCTDPLLVFYQITKNMPALTFWSEPEGQSRHIFCVLVKYQHFYKILQNVGILPEFFKATKKMAKGCDWSQDVEKIVREAGFTKVTWGPFEQVGGLIEALEVQK